MKVGDTNEFKMMITDEFTAAAGNPGAPRVFGTPYLVGFMEQAGLEYMARELPEGKGTVGTMVNVIHSAATPVGMEVTVKVTVTNISPNGKVVDFDMEAFDEKEKIGTGKHQRAVIDNEKFLARCYAKL